MEKATAFDASQEIFQSEVTILLSSCSDGTNSNLIRSSISVVSSGHSSNLPSFLEPDDDDDIYM
jgi:hypothetical protein